MTLPLTPGTGERLPALTRPTGNVEAEIVCGGTGIAGLSRTNLLTERGYQVTVLKARAPGAAGRLILKTLCLKRIMERLPASGILLCTKGYRLLAEYERGWNICRNKGVILWNQRHAKVVSEPRNIRPHADCWRLVLISREFCSLPF